MKNTLFETVDGMQEILAICPCCGELFRLVNGKFIFPQRKTRDSEYLDLISAENEIDKINQLVAEEEDEFASNLELLRGPLRDQARLQASQRIRSIDPLFSALEIEPQDVKALMHPIEYIIFHGLTANTCINPVEFISRSPKSRAEELIVDSVDKTIKQGDVCFETLRMLSDGSFEIEEA